MKQHHCLYLIASCILLSGCGQQYVNWADRTFNQGCLLPDYPRQVKPFLRTERLYHQFETVGIFDALWLADSVRVLYVDLFTEKFDKGYEEYETLLKEQLEKNKKLITFYLLSEKEYVPRGLKMITSKEHTLWGIHLEIDDKVLHPITIEKIDLNASWRRFFGKRMSFHKQAYKITFDAHSKTGESFINLQSEQMDLVLSNTKVRTCLQWDNPLSIVLQAECAKDLQCE